MGQKSNLLGQLPVVWKDRILHFADRFKKELYEIAHHEIKNGKNLQKLYLTSYLLY